MLFDFDIKYRAGRTNQAADALSQWPENPDSSSVSSDGEKEWKTIIYEMVCQILDYHLKLPYQVKHGIQTNIADVDEANQFRGFQINQYHRCTAKGSENFQLNHAKTNGGVPEERLPAVTSL